MTHYYDSGIPGVPPYPSVTTITRRMLEEPPGIKMWKLRNKNWKEEMNYKAKIGTISHYRILRKFSPSTLKLPELKFSDFPENATMYADIAESMFDDLGLDISDPIYVEHIVRNHEYRYAGTLDMAARINGKFTLVDLKTSAYDKRYGIREEYKLQLGGYYGAFDHKGEKPEAAAIIYINPFEEKNPELKAKVVYMPIEDVKIYMVKFQEMATEFHKLNC
mgnify:CR=1 FL=1